MAFQRRYSWGFGREAALLSTVSESDGLRVFFRAKTGIDVLHFMDFAYATYVQILRDVYSFDVKWFDVFRPTYGDAC
jgi:hypothetical protein